MLAKCKILFLFFLAASFNCKESKEITQEVNIVKDQVKKVDVQIKIVEAGAHQVNAYFETIKGKRVALLVNQTSMIGESHLADSLKNLGINIVKIFATEHGFRGEADAGETVKNGIDTKTGIPISSLYGKKKKPSKDDLKDVDIIVFDIQDVGARFYTYIAGMSYAMEACAENNVEFIVLDRPNPNGHYIDGPVMKDQTSFLGLHRSVPVVHGMTIGEYARMVNEEGWLKNGVKCNLTVISCMNYNHKIYYELPVRPSPNLPNMHSIYLYPSTCFFEGTTASEGRGTNKQFQVYGHPKYKGGDYSFTPKSMAGAKYPKHENELCRGYDLSKKSIEEIKAEGKLNLDYLINFYKSFPKNETFFLENNFFDKLAGSSELRTQIINGVSSEEIRKSWKPDLEKFKQIRKKYLLYEDFY